MRWKGGRRSSNIEDRRGMKASPKAVGGLGIGGIVILLIYVFLGGDPAEVMDQMPAQQQSTQQSDYQPTAQEEELAEFVSVVLASTEDVWKKLFPEQLNRRYKEPILVIFSGSVQSACGSASSATGPFYCPADNRLYIDLSFYNDLKNKLDAPGDFAMAYVVAHEVAHHIQNLMGNTGYVHSQRGKVSGKEYNQLSVRLELQADFLAGVWAHHADDMYNILEEGDIEEALNAAHQIGDDRLQKMARGRVMPDSFTHGTSK
ncbi:MAG: hypothetical protein HKN32_02560, partial [Flavobacteriales bacterium]|nr:hypothetical protein [Flavobacteriales bacterium]